MSVFKTYTHVNQANVQALFGISRMEDIFDKRQGATDEPHRHDYFTVLLTRKAKGQHVIDFSAYDLQPQQVFFVGPGQVHQVIEEQRSEGFSIVFSADFLAKNNIPISFIDDLNLFRNYGEAPPLLLNTEALKILVDYCEKMMQFYQSELEFKSRAMAALLELFLIHCTHLCKKPTNPQQLEAGNSILRSFKALVEEHHKTEHSTSFYASQLHITPDHLNRTIKSLIGKSAKEYIQNRIIIAAKRLLIFSPATNKEISYELGFSEPTHFSAFFKNCTHLSPTAFKQQHTN